MMADFRGPWPTKLEPIATRDRIDDIPDVSVGKSHTTKFPVTYRGRLIGYVRRDLHTGNFGYQLVPGPAPDTRGIAHAEHIIRNRNLSHYGPFKWPTKREAVVAFVAYVDSIGGDIDSVLNDVALHRQRVLTMWRAQSFRPDLVKGK